MSKEVFAKRGDLVVVCTTRRAAVTAQGRSMGDPVEQAILGRVSSVSRDGQVKAWQTPLTRTGELSTQKAQHVRADRTLIVSADSLDVEAALEAFREHTWDVQGAPGDMVRSFDGVPAVREFLRPFRA